MGDVEKVFLSWSGERSKAVATALHRYLPVLTDRAEPFMSDADIEAGQRGLREIEGALDGACFGIIVVTPENQDSQWLNFESGALSRAITGEARVVPVLVGMNRPTDMTGPLSQFQAQIWGRAGIRNLCVSLGTVLGLRSDIIDDRVEMVWEKLDSETSEAIARGPSPQAAKRDQGEVLDEVLELVRALHRDASRSVPMPVRNGATVREQALLDAEYAALERMAYEALDRLNLTRGSLSWDSESREMVATVLEESVSPEQQSSFRRAFKQANARGILLPRRVSKPPRTSPVT